MTAQAACVLVLLHRGIIKRRHVYSIYRDVKAISEHGDISAAENE